MLFNIWISSCCNLKCDYCYCKTKLGASQTKLDIDKVSNLILSQSDMLSRNWINFHGGEPLLEWEHMRDIIFLLENTKFKFHYSFTSNGTIMNEGILNLIKKYHIDVSFSCDGNQLTHDLYRTFSNGEGSYKYLWKTLETLVKNKIDPRIRLTFNSVTVDSLYDNITCFLKAGFHDIAISPDFFDKEWNEISLKIFEKQFQNIKNFIQNTDYVFDYVDKKSIHKYSSCTGGKSGIQIYSDGRLYTCSYNVGEPLFCIGTLETGIDYERRDELLKMCKNKIELCHDCSIKAYCIANRCKYLNYAITNSLEHPSGTVCALERVRIMNALGMYNENH